METSIPTLGVRVVDGDVALLGDLRRIDHVALSDGLAGHRLVVRPEAVRRVLRGLLAGSISGEDAQAWASFVRRGYFPRSLPGPITPLVIDYDAAFEDAIVEAVSRLDEIGDLIDGHVGKHELVELLNQLS